MPDPIVEVRLYASKSPPRWYVKIRRGMPIRPSMCWGKKVRLKPMNTSQKWAFPSPSSSNLPKIFGHQK